MPVNPRLAAIVVGIVVLIAATVGVLYATGHLGARPNLTATTGAGTTSTSTTASPSPEDEELSLDEDEEGEVELDDEEATLGVQLLASQRCTGSTQKYLERIHIKTDRPGTGHLKTLERPDFERDYSIKIPPSKTFTSEGTFSFYNLKVPGKIRVTIKKMRPTEILYRETTDYGTCKNTYAGTLTKKA